MTSSQMLKGVLEGCVLALIGRGETYGYELVGALAACGLPGIAEGTLYPLLVRLEKRASSPRCTVSPRSGRGASITA